jgi:hypothetical protein
MRSHTVTPLCPPTTGTVTLGARELWRTISIVLYSNESQALHIVQDLRYKGGSTNDVEGSDTEEPMR